MKPAPASESHDLSFDPQAHAYRLDGRPVPGVTTITGVLDAPALDDWRARIGELEAERRRDAAADFGTRLHAAAAAIARGQRLLELDVPGRWQAAVDLVAKWYADNVETVLAVEQGVASARWQYAGTIDAVVILRGRKRPDIIDYKSGAGVYLSSVLQLAGYQIAEREWNGYACGRLVLHLPAPLDEEEPPRLKVHRLTRDSSDQAAFYCARGLYTRTKEPLL